MSITDIQPSHLAIPAPPELTESEANLLQLVKTEFSHLDSTGNPYWCHLERVGHRAATLVLHYEPGNFEKASQARRIGFTHDCIEDIEKFQKNPQLLVEAGLPKELLPSVYSVTHDKTEDYRDAIEPKRTA